MSTENLMYPRNDFSTEKLTDRVIRREKSWILFRREMECAWWGIHDVVAFAQLIAYVRIY